MSAMAVPSSSSLNPNAPLFIPAAYRQVEDFSPQWWDLVHTTAWFRDHVFRQQYQHQQLHEEAPQQHHDADAALPDDDDLFYAPDHHLFSQYQEEPSSGGAEEMLRTLNLASWEPQHQPSIRHADKLPAAAQQHVGITANARRFIHQAR